MKWLRFAASALALLISACADTLQLHDGRVIEGTFISGDRASIRFRPATSRHIRVYSRSRVANIIFGEAAEGTPAHSTSVETTSVAPSGTATPAETPMPAATPAAPNIQSGGNFIPGGTVVHVRVADRVDCDAARIGDNFTVSLAQPIIVNGQTIAPAGSQATMEVVGVGAGNRLTETGDIALKLVNLTASDGRTFNVSTTNAVAARAARTAQVSGAVSGSVTAADRFLVGRHIAVQPGTELSFTLEHDVDF